MNTALDTRAILEWFYRHGRHDLPWQQNISPYRVWVSEIMLQQTQVSTVIPYYQRFMENFPDVHALAAAEQDQVLHLWTGLGYYARARNLHKTAGIVSQQYGGTFPDNLASLSALPGIGRSTAGAIMAIAQGKRGIILDGNVKRVLCRYYAIEGWSGQTAVQRRLWELAEASTPESEVAAYTQAMMDLGATLCTRGKPACLYCPLQKGCQALARGLTDQLPAKKPRKKLPEKRVFMVLCLQDDSVLLQQRQSNGLWGGLWSLPECTDQAELDDWLQCHGASMEAHWPVLRHSFSHFHLDITPVLARQAEPSSLRTIQDSAGILWHPLHTDTDREAPAIGMAAPVKKLLNRLAKAL